MEREKMIDSFVIIVGSMKSGTTTLFEYLSQHPEVAPCSLKEPAYFVLEDRLEKGFEWYEGLWNWDPGLHKIALEASTSYTKIPVFPNAAEEIRRAGRNFKIIYLMRDPVKRVESQIAHTLLSSGNGLAGIPRDLINNAISYSKYAMQITEYFKRFAKEDIFLLCFEDFIKDPVHQAGEIVRFLGLKSDYRFKKIFPQNEKYNLLVKQKLSKIESIKFLIPEKVRWFVRGVVSRNYIFRWYADNYFQSNLVLARKTLKHIHEELEEDTQRLATEYKFDISTWSR
jgi:hypothetical protein